MQNELFEAAPVPKAYMKLALPVVMSMMVSLVYNMVFTILTSVFAPAVIKIFMNQSDIIKNGAMMLRFQQLGVC